MPDAFLATASNPQSVDLRTLAHLLPLELRDAVLAAVSLSLSVSTRFAFRKPNLTQAIEDMDCLYPLPRRCILGVCPRLGRLPMIDRHLTAVSLP